MQIVRKYYRAIVLQTKTIALSSSFSHIAHATFRIRTFNRDIQ